jgi:hypothetical protein
LNEVGALLRKLTKVDHIDKPAEVQIKFLTMKKKEAQNAATKEGKNSVPKPSNNMVGTAASLS